MQKPSRKPARRRQQATFSKFCSIAIHNNLFLKVYAVRTGNPIPVAEYVTLHYAAAPLCPSFLVQCYSI
jgi:hypothetical protein